jgi:hypothetical protein
MQERIPRARAGRRNRGGLRFILSEEGLMFVGPNPRREPVDFQPQRRGDRRGRGHVVLDGFLHLVRKRA